MSVELDEIDDPHYDDLEPILSRFVSIWIDGSETAWLRHAWGVLARADLTSYETEAERTRVVCRALALGVLLRAFHSVAFQEGLPDGRWVFPDDCVGDEWPLLQPLMLGVVAERDRRYTDHLPSDEEEPGQVLADVLEGLVLGEIAAVRKTLLGEWGENFLFANLWSSKSEVEYPLTDENYYEAVDSDSFDKLAAYAWMQEGMSLSDIPI